MKPNVKMEMNNEESQMNGRFKGAWLVSLTVGLLGAVDASAEAGRTAGQWGVSPAGAATYSIPIWTPSGQRGIQPSIALSYNSRSSMGLVGMGWSIAGLSSITRCLSTQSQDGTSRTVSLDYDDRFCLDGNKLRITNGSLTEYGQPGKEYETEIATFSRITSLGTLGQGPESFLVHTKSGLILEYGNTSDSRVTRGGATVLIWMLNKFSDRNGNRYVVTYRNDADGIAPDKIKWAATSAGAYQYQMSFAYSLRTDPKEISSMLNAGLDISNRYRLDNISVGYSSDGTSYATTRQYIAQYLPSPTTNLSRLVSVKECAADTDHCLLPTTMGYQNGSMGVLSTPTTGVAAAASASKGRFDFNGDGRNDLYWTQAGTIRVAFGTGTGFSGSFNTLLTSGGAGRFLASHKDGFLTNVSGTWRYTGWNGTAFVTTNTGIAVNSGTVITDPNGDGMADLIWVSSAPGNNYRINVRLNTTSGAAASAPTFSAPTVGLQVPVGQKGGSLSIIPYSECPLERQCDVDGNGAPDLAAALTTTFNCPVSGPCTPISTIQELFAGNGGYSMSPITNGATGPVFLGIRFNDDPCIDKIFGGTTAMLISPCRRGAAGTPVTLPAAPAAVLDWDGDGNTDLLVNNGGIVGIYRSNGTVSNPFGSLITTSIPFNTGCSYFGADFDGDGLDELACASTVSPFAVTYYTHAGGGSAGTSGGGVYLTQLPDVISSITDGYGVSFSPSYVSTAQRNYTPGTGTASPLVDDVSARVVVGRATLSDGLGSAYTLDYSYLGARRNGNLEASAPIDGGTQATLFGPDGADAGFEQISIVDSRNSNLIRTTYHQDFPRTGMAKKVELFQSDQVTKISTTDTENLFHTFPASTNNQRYFPYPWRITTNVNEVSPDSAINGASTAISVVTYTFADFTYGNVSSVKTEKTDTYAGSPLVGKKWTTTLENVYQQPDISNWCVGLVSTIKITEESSEPGISPIEHNLQFDKDTNDAAKCRSYREITEPGSSKYRVTQTYEFDDFGNTKKVTVAGLEPTADLEVYTAMAPRVTETPWSDTGLFPKEVTNAEGAKISLVYEPASGDLKKVTDANGLESTYDYDAFGRQTKSTNPDGTYTRTIYEDCAAQGCVYGTHKVTVTQLDVGTDNQTITRRLSYLDAQGRNFATVTQPLNGYPNYNLKVRWSEVEYDALGRVFRSWMPCLSDNLLNSCHAFATTYTYDQLGRVVQITRPTSASVPAPVSTKYRYAGRTLTIEDAQSKLSTRIDDVKGNLRQIQDMNGYSVFFTRDAAGSIIGIKDSTPVDKLTGVRIEYGARPFVVEQTDSAMGHLAQTYNSLGELVQWTDANNHTFRMTYDKLSRPLTRDEPDENTRTTWNWGTGAGPAPDLYNKGRLRSISSKERGETYVESYEYDSLSRLKYRTIAIPGDATYQFELAYSPASGLLDTLKFPAIMGGEQLVLKYGYQNGLLQSISAPGGSPQYWLAKYSNARGQVTEDYFGNATKRVRTYDDVTGWLTSITSGGNSDPTSLQMEKYLYDLVGNVIQRANDKLTLSEDFFYGGGLTNDNLYRLEHSDLNAGSGAARNFGQTYDLTGNIVTKETPNVPDQVVTQSILWTNYNLPREITANAGNGLEKVTFAYGPLRQRWRMEYQNSDGTETTYYIAGVLEKVVKGGVASYRQSIEGGGGIAAIYSRGGGDPGTFKYLLPDHLGSIETIASSNAEPLARESFSAYGERRDASDWSGPPGDRALLDGMTRQGYTYQTVLGSMGLNHMNGRVQDAITGRFLSPDPYIPDPAYTQAYNRYAYVYNNPLTYNDPSGFIPFEHCYWERGSYSAFANADNPEEIARGITGTVISVSDDHRVCYTFDVDPIDPGDIEGPPIDEIPTGPGPNFGNDNDGNQEKEREDPCAQYFAEVRRREQVREVEDKIAELLNKVGMTADELNALALALKQLPDDAMIMGIGPKSTWAWLPERTVLEHGFNSPVMDSRFGAGILASELRSFGGTLLRYGPFIGNLADAIEFTYALHNERWADAGFIAADVAINAGAMRTRNPWVVAGAATFTGLIGTKNLLKHAGPAMELEGLRRACLGGDRW